MNRKKYDDIERSLRSLRTDDEHGLVVSFGAHRDENCGKRGNLSCTITKQGQTATSHALHLVDAVSMARGKANRMIKAEKERLEKEKESAQ